MGLALQTHIVAAGFGLVFGWVALSATKGSALHRKSGLLFVYAMLTMSATAAVLAALKGNVVNVIASFLTSYMVTTALFAVRPATPVRRRVEIAAMIVGFVLAAGC